MNGKHWSDDELLDHLYGVGPENNHLKACADCSERWHTLEASRRAFMQDPEVSSVRLLQQRTAILQRIERSQSTFFSWRFLTALSGATAMALGVLVYTPQHTNPVAVQTASSDTQFFSEIYSEMEQTEPRAVRPIRKLFKEQP